MNFTPPPVLSRPPVAGALPLSDAQKRELGARLAHHRAHPDEPGITLDEIRRKLTGG